MVLKNPPVIGRAGFKQPVHDSRHRQRVDRRTGKPKGPLRNDEFVLGVLDRLDKLEQQTRPDTTDASLKDLKAFQALESASFLIEYIAGWALDHQMGLAMNELSFVPLQPSQTRDSKDYHAARARVDTHEHEYIGGRLLLDELDPVVARHYVANLLRAMGHLRIPRNFYSALLALDYGETLPPVAPIKSTKRSGLTELYCKLQAICFVEYEYMKGMRKENSRKIIAKEFRTAERSVAGWEEQIGQFLSPLLIASEKATASNMGQLYRGVVTEDEDTGRNYADLYEERVGLPALKRAAKQYLARGKLRKPSPRKA